MRLDFGITFQHLKCANMNVYHYWHIVTENEAPPTIFYILFKASFKGLHKLTKIFKQSNLRIPFLRDLLLKAI